MTGTAVAGRLCVALLVLLSCALSLAATELLVDGQLVPGLDQQTVPGVSYAPAAELARAMGASLEQDRLTVGLELGASRLLLRITGDRVRTDSPGSVALDGRAIDGHAALLTENGLLLPVKTVASAFGGIVTVLTGNRDAVEVRMPQARLTSLQRSTSGGSERLLVGLSAPVPVSVYLNEQLGTLQVTFLRTRTVAGLVPLEGVNFEQAWLIDSTGQPELRVRLAEGASHRVTASSTTGGWQLELTLVPPPSDQEPQERMDQQAVPDRSAVQLSHAGGQELADLALATSSLLQAAGVRVLPAGSEPLGARLRLQLTPGPGGSELHFLSDATDEHSLAVAVALAGGDAAGVERLRREILLGMHGDTSVARGMAVSLQQQLGLDTPPLGLPDAGLLRGPGPVIRLLLDPDELGDPSLPERLGQAVLLVLQQTQESP